MYSPAASVARLPQAVFGFLLLFAWGTAVAVPPKDILFQAIHTGAASEVLTGPIAQGLQAKTQSSSPVLMSAKVVKRFHQAGCARLQVTMRQENVPKKDGGTGPLEFSYEMNLCSDGLPPAESIDWSKAPPPAASATPEQIK
ncbi:hypothetical protein [Ralstonia pseudosolanacearum]|uniref:hypothetical protein n=1 Tax=Ralstonia pseudosolanacearum TaxID=1310165 RepID=UPI003CF995F2